MIELNRFWLRHDESLLEHEMQQRVSLSHDLYRGMPTWFNAYYAHFQRRAVLTLLHHCGSLSGMRVLDVGCGTGRWSKLLAAKGATLVGVDMGLCALRLAAKQASGEFSAAKLPELSFADNVFDLIISVAVLQHIPRSQQEKAIRALVRVLRPSGWLIVCELAERSDPAPYVFGNSAETWRAMFRAAGLRQAAYKPCEYLPYVKMFQRMGAWLERLKIFGSTRPDVSSVAVTLQRFPALAWMLRLAITISYPIEYLASWFLPPRWARMGGFLLVKE